MIRERARERKGRKDRQHVFSMTVALGILSHATILHSNTLCMFALCRLVFAGVTLGVFCLTQLARCYQACRALVLEFFLIDTETLSPLHCSAQLIPAINVDFQLKL